MINAEYTNPGLMKALNQAQVARIKQEYRVSQECGIMRGMVPAALVICFVGLVQMRLW